MEQPLYDISLNETLFCQTDLIRKNVRFVIELIDANGRLKSWDEISNDFNLGPIEFLEWYGIIKSNWQLIQPIGRFITVFQEMVKQ